MEAFLGPTHFQIGWKYVKKIWKIRHVLKRLEAKPASCFGVDELHDFWNSERGEKTADAYTLRGLPACVERGGQNAPTGSPDRLKPEEELLQQAAEAEAWQLELLQLPLGLRQRCSSLAALCPPRSTHTRWHAAERETRAPFSLTLFFCLQQRNFA